MGQRGGEVGRTRLAAGSMWTMYFLGKGAQMLARVKVGKAIVTTARI